jgi:hypothetical protein
LRVLLTVRIVQGFREGKKSNRPFVIDSESPNNSLAVYRFDKVNLMKLIFRTTGLLSEKVDSV